MTARLEDYREVAPRGALDLLCRLGERLRGRRFVHVNAGRFGAGSPELLARLVPLLQELGIEARWEVVVGDPAFYATVRGLERALTGQASWPPGASLAAWEDAAGSGARLDLDADVVMVHDVAPLALIARRPPRGRWVWRCHADLSRAYRRAWHAVQRYVERYDATVFSLPKFAQRVRVPMLIVHPSVDPLGEKNRELTRSEIQQALDQLDVPRDRPLVLRIGPFTRSQDLAGAIRACRLARRYERCRLVLAGWGGAEPPDGPAVLAEVQEEAARDGEVQVLQLPPEAARELNALQRAAAVVLHTPLQEDFGLVATEAMWKGKPVVATPAGGLPAQVIPEVTGFLIHSVEGAAFRLRQLLQNPELAARLGGAAREYVRRSFLLTRHLGDYLALLAVLTGP